LCSVQETPLLKQGKIVIKQLLGLRPGDERVSAIHDAMTISAAINTRAILVVRWVEVIGWIVSMVSAATSARVIA
jgi:hypothetical protein